MVDVDANGNLRLASILNHLGSNDLDGNPLLIVDLRMVNDEGNVDLLSSSDDAAYGLEGLYLLFG